MSTSTSKVVTMQWVVITVLVLGGGAAVWLAASKANQYQTDLQRQTGNINSLREQLRQAKATPTPSVTLLPEATANGPAATSTPKPSATPKTTPSLY